MAEVINKYMNAYRYCFVLQIIAIFVGFMTQHAWSTYQELDRVVAIVKKDVITKSEVNAKIELFRSHSKGSEVNSLSERQVREKVLEQLILESIQEQLAENAGIRVNDLMLNDTMEKIAHDNGGSVSAFKKQLEQQGISYSQVREDVKKDMLLNLVRQKYVGHQITVSEQEVDKYLATSFDTQDSQVQYRLGHIMITLSEGYSLEEEQKALKRAKEVKQKMLKGEDIDKLAQKYSQGAQKSGDLGWLSEEMLPTLYFETAEKLKKNEVAIAKSAVGFHVLRLIDVQGGKHAQYQDQLHVRRVIIATSAVISDLDAKNRVNNIYRMINERKGSFADLAKTYSDDSLFGPGGGDMGWTDFDSLPKAIQVAAQSKQFKKPLIPFKTEEGWWVAEILGQRVHDIGHQLKRKQAQLVLQDRLFKEVVNVWLRDIRRQSFVEIKSE